MYDLFDHVLSLINPFYLFQPSVAFHIETNHLVYKTNRMTGFYIKGNTELK